MADSEKNITMKTPPLFVRMVFFLTAGPTNHQAAIGDLQEEFEQRMRVSMLSANLWCFRQAFFSVPYFIWNRVLESDKKSGLFIFPFSFLAFVVITFWEANIARGTATSFASAFSHISRSNLSAIYNVVSHFGFLLTGLGIAYFLFDRTTPFFHNIATRFLPVICIIFSLGLANAILNNPQYPLIDQLFWFATTIPTLIAGAIFGCWLQKIIQ